MSVNYGLGSRYMDRAGAIAINRHYDSFQSRASVKQRWDRFVEYVRVQGVRKMEHITTEHIRDYAEDLREDGLSPATQQNYVSAVNIVMEVARQDREVRLDPSEVCDRRTGVAEIDRSVADREHELARDQVNDRISALLDLQREFGLRFEESAKINARSALNQANRSGSIEISRGTKGGQSRELEIRKEIQIQVLERASEIQQDDRSMIPGDQTYIEFKHQAYREIDQTEINFHAERHTYAQTRYEELVGVPAPVKIDHQERSWSHFLAKELGIGIRDAKDLDRQARLTVSKELGHHREDVVAAYIGGKS